MNTLTIQSWGEMTTKLFHQGREVVRLNSRVTPNKGATILEYTAKSTGDLKQFVYADEATVVDRDQALERKRQERELFKLYMTHEIGLEQYTSALKELQA